MSQLKTSLIVVAIAALAGSGYYYKQQTQGANLNSGEAKNSKDAKPAARPVAVTTILAQKRDYPVRLSANGTVSSLNTVEVRAQITATVAKVHIKEGQFVKAGDLLFTLDSRADEANLQKALAQLDKDLATLADNQRQLARNKDLFAKKYIAQSVVDSSETQVQAQQAVINTDKAAIAAAKVALSYARIVAPASGRTGLINVFAGSLVQANASATPLVTITQMDPIAITFPLPQRNLNDALHSMENPESLVSASLPDTDKKFLGKLQFVDNVVDASSGTIKVKAVFENKELKLWPGAYANLELSIKTLKDAIVVPQDAVVIGARGNSVFVVNADSKVEQKSVKIVQSFADEVAITGIEPGSKVVLDGKQNLRPGNPVKERNSKEADAGKRGASAAAAGSSGVLATSKSGNHAAVSVP